MSSKAESPHTSHNPVGEINTAAVVQDHAFYTSTLDNAATHNVVVNKEQGIPISIEDVRVLCSDLREHCRKFGYRLVISGRTAQYLSLSAEKLKKLENARFNDLDFLLVGIPDIRDNGESIIEMLSGFPGSQVLKRKAPLDQVKYWLKGEDAKKTKAHAVRAGENIWMVA